MASRPGSKNDGYVVNGQTLLLQPVQHGAHTLVYEKSCEPVRVNKPPLEIVRQSCIRYLTTYEGKREASAIILGINRKVPINIDEVKGTYLFPTVSHLKHDCVWITLSHLKQVAQIEKKLTEVTFSDNQKIKVPVSSLTIYNQIMLTAELYKRGNERNGFGTKKKAKRAQYITGRIGDTLSFFQPCKRE